MYEMGVDDVRRPPLDLLEQTQNQQRVRVASGREARHRDAVLADRVHERLEPPGAEHQHLCLDAALLTSAGNSWRRWRSEPPMLPDTFWTCRTRIRDVRPAAGTPTVTLERPSWPGSPRAGDEAQDGVIGTEHLSDKTSLVIGEFHESGPHNRGS